jgi:hypothetical protein
MPTLEHNGLIEMFRENPALAPRFLTTVLHVEIPPHAAVRVADSALDQLIPVEFRADLVLELLDDRGKVLLALILEAQREIDPRKKYTWPVYAAVVRAERECPAVVLVIATSADVAAWAAEKIDLGLGLGSLVPLVLGPRTLPVVTDPAVAAREVELAILSTMAHGNGPEGLAVVTAAFEAITRLDQEHAAVYFQIIWNVLGEPMQRALERLVMERQVNGEVTFPPFVQQLIDRGFRDGELKGLRDGKLEGLRDGKLEGLRDGKLEGLRDGKLEGLHDGELKGLRDALLRLIARAQIPLAEDDRARIQACDDAATLDRWIENIIGAKAITDVLC